MPPGAFGDFAPLPRAGKELLGTRKRRQDEPKGFGASAASAALAGNWGHEQILFTAI